MDPVTAFQLAGTVLTFIDFGTRLINLSVEIYHKNGLSSQLAQVASGFQSTLNDIKLPAQYQSQASDSGLDQLVVDCKNFSTELLERLRKAGLLEPPSKSRREAFRTALRLMLRENEQKGLLDQLDQLRNRLNLHLLVSLR